MIAVVKNCGLSMTDFWNMPLSTIYDLLGLFKPLSKQPITRKQLIDKERELNRLWS